MELKGSYKLSYTLDREPKDLSLLIELKQVEGIPPKGRNVWEGIATLDGHPYTKEDLRWCVNARIAAERIGKKLRDEIKTNAHNEEHSFRVKKEEIK
jgi:hypothetical protein